jgi:dynein heavy chain
MNIVLFKDAISYLCKVYRIIKLSRGHGMLVGEGGSGRHSLTRLAAFLADY